MKHDFEGKHSYVLVQTKNLPTNLPDVYIEGIHRHWADNDDNSEDHGDSSSEENHSRGDEYDDASDEDDDDDHNDDDDSEENEGHHRLQHLKIRVYNHTVEFKRNLKLLVSIKGILHTTLLSHFLVMHFQHTITSHIRLPLPIFYCEVFTEVVRQTMCKILFP